MNCDAFQQWIALSLYGELSAEERRGLDAHLAACPSCREAERAYAGTVSLLRRASPALPTRPRVPGLWRAAAAAVVLVGLAVWIAEAARIRRPEPPAPIAEETAPSARLAEIEGDLRLALSVPDEDFLGDLAAGGEASLAVRATVLLGRKGTRRAEPPLRAALARPATRLVAFDALLDLGRLDPRKDIVPALAAPLLRRRAAELLMARGTAEAFDALLVRASAGDRTCLAACRGFRPDVSLPSLSAALADPARRATAVDILLTADGDPFREALLAAAGADEAVRASALGLARETISAPRSARFLVAALCDEALSSFASEALASTPVRRLRGVLLEAMRADAPAVALFLASRSKEAAARDLLVEALAREEVRAEAGRALLAQGDLRAVGPLLRGGSRGDLDALTALPAEVRRRELARALGASTTRAAALRAIGREDASMWRDVVPFLKDDRLRGEALAAIARTGVDRAIPFLIPYLSGSEEGKVVRVALVELAGEDFGEEARDWKAWWRAQMN